MTITRKKIEDLEDQILGTDKKKFLRSLELAEFFDPPAYIKNPESKSIKEIGKEIYKHWIKTGKAGVGD